MKSEKENEKVNSRSATEGDACQSKNEMGVAIGVDNEVIEKVLRRVAVGRDNSANGRVVGRGVVTLASRCSCKRVN